MKRRRNTFTVTSWVDVDGEEIDVEIEVEVSPYRPMRGPTMNDPGSPAEGGEVESWEVFDASGARRADLDDRFTAEELLELVERQGGDDDGPDYDEDRDEVRAENREWNRENDRGDY